MFSMIKNLMKQEDGQTIVEYCIMLVVVALAVVGMFPSVTGAITGVFDEVIAQLAI